MAVSVLFGRRLSGIALLCVVVGLVCFGTTNASTDGNVRGSEIDQHWGEGEDTLVNDGRILADDDEGKEPEIFPTNDEPRKYVYANPRYAIRARRAEVQERHSSSLATQNGDRLLSVNRNGVLFSVAVFSKTLVHNEYGEVPTKDFELLEKAMATGLQSDFDAIRRSPGGTRKLTNPQAALAAGLTGPDAFAIPLPPAPRFQSTESAFEMVELYGFVLLRDIPFYALENELGDSRHLMHDLLHDLNQHPEYFKGRLNAEGYITPQSINRGAPEGCSIGPVVSQFFLHDFDYGNMRLRQEIAVEADKALSVDVQGWLGVQRGIVTATPTPLYPTIRACNWRALGSYVHNDPPCSAFINAALMLNQFGAPLSPSIPTLKNEGTFVTFGIADVVSAINEVCQIGFKSAWRQKWSVNLRLRPEVMAGRTHFTLKGGQRYGIDPLLLESRTLQHAHQYNAEVLGHDTYLLSQMYTEGSPAHPSYPAGHGVVAGAAATVLKAFFDDSVLLSTLSNKAGQPFEVIESRTCHETYGEMLAHPIRDPSVLDRMTVGGEIDKMAINIGSARCAAGVHYISDASKGTIMGEKVAIRYLSDRAVTYNENFGGFTFKQFNGKVVGVKTINHKWPPTQQPTYSKAHA